jgi:hypothetical protein
MSDKPKSLAAGLTPLPKRALYADAPPEATVGRTTSPETRAAKAKLRADTAKALNDVIKAAR